MTASLPSDSGPALAPLGFIEPHALLLTQPAPDQRLFKIMKAEHFIQSIEGGYLQFNRVDAYSDFPLADAHDGAELPLDQPANQAASFEKAPGFTLSDYYARSRARTYACCFSLENSPYMWEHYGLGSAMGQVGLEFDLEKLRRRLNGALSGESALMCGDIQCRQIFSINYGEVAYVDRATHRGNLDRAANPSNTPTSRTGAMAKSANCASVCRLWGWAGLSSPMVARFSFRPVCNSGSISARPSLMEQSPRS